MRDPKPHWRTPDDTSEPLEVGDRIVAVCWYAERHRKVKRHVITLTIHEDGVTRDNEKQGFCLEDCEAWMPEAEFLRMVATEPQADAPPNATPWQQPDGWEGRT